MANIDYSVIYTLEEAKQYLKEALLSRSRTLEMLKYTVNSGEQEVERNNLKILDGDISLWEKVITQLTPVARKRPTIKYGTPRG